MPPKGSKRKSKKSLLKAGPKGNGDKFDKMDRKGLNRECKLRGLACSGKNDEKRQRIRDYDATKTAEAPKDSDSDGESSKLSEATLSEVRYDFDDMTTFQLLLECCKRNLLQNSRNWIIDWLKAHDAGVANSQAPKPDEGGQAQDDSKAQNDNTGEDKGNAKDDINIETKGDAQEDKNQLRELDAKILREAQAEADREDAWKLQEAEFDAEEVENVPEETSAEVQRQGELERRSRITVGPIRSIPQMDMNQHQVKGDGLCLWRAFARALWGEEEGWKLLRVETMNWWKLVTDRQSRAKGYTESRSRRALYKAMNIQSTPANMRVRSRRHVSPTTLIVGDDATGPADEPGSGANLAAQVNVFKTWGQIELLQVFADLYDVEIFAFTSVADGSWEVYSRGDFGRRQIFLANYTALQHWSALTPVEDSQLLVTGHIQNVLYDEETFLLSRTPVLGCNRRPPRVRKNNPTLRPQESYAITVPPEYAKYVDRDEGGNDVPDNYYDPVAPPANPVPPTQGGKDDGDKDIDLLVEDDLDEDNEAGEDDDKDAEAHDTGAIGGGNIKNGSGGNNGDDGGAGASGGGGKNADDGDAGPPGDAGGKEDNGGKDEQGNTGAQTSGQEVESKETSSHQVSNNPPGEPDQPEPSPKSDSSSSLSDYEETENANEQPPQPSTGQGTIDLSAFTFAQPANSRKRKRPTALDLWPLVSGATNGTH